MKAFFFVQNSNYGYDFWEGMQEKFVKYVEEFFNQEHAMEWRAMHGRKRAMLLQDWDSKQWWRHENKQEAFARVMKLLVRIGAMDEDEANIELKAKEENKKKHEELSKIANEARKNEVDSFLDDFEDVLIKPSKKNTCRIKKDEISINRKSAYTVTFNNDVTEEIRNRGCYEHATIMSKNGVVTIMLNDLKRGVPMRIKTSSKREKSNAIISSKDFVNKLAQLLNLGEDETYVKVKIKEISKGDAYVAYELTKIV